MRRFISVSVLILAGLLFVDHRVSLESDTPVSSAEILGSGSMYERWESGSEWRWIESSVFIVRIFSSKPRCLRWKFDVLASPARVSKRSVYIDSATKGVSVLNPEVLSSIDGGSPTVVEFSVKARSVLSTIVFRVTGETTQIGQSDERRARLAVSRPVEVSQGC
jgi:hypothetical protein